MRFHIGRNHIYRTIRFLLALLVLLTPALASASLNQQLANPPGPDMADSNGNAVTGGGLSAAGEYATVTGALSVEPGVRSPAPLLQQDYQNVYEQARALLDTGITFRTTQLQLPPSCSTPEECQINYQDFNDGELYYGFCSDYERIDPRGYCPGDEPTTWPTATVSIRGQLVRAREMFGFLALADPVTTQLTVDGQSVPVRAVGREGVLEATREIANIHMLFGNEFLVDATDYRFSGGDPRADQIIAEEINQLQLARQQFSLAVDVLSHAYNADLGGPYGGYIGDYFGAREFDLFGIVSERMVQTIGEIADRYRQLGKDEEALALYAKAFANQYVQAMALAYSAAERNASFMENGGWEIVNNLEQLRARAQTIHDGINPFGFVDEYVPLQTYSELRELTQGDFLRDATEDENRAENAQREFDRNATAMSQELQNLRLTYENQLFEMCGPSDDDYATCTGGLMEQNRHALDAAVNRARLVEERLLNIPKQIQIEQERAGEVIELVLANGEAMGAFEYTKGVINSYRVTEATIDSTTDEWHVGGESRLTLTTKVCAFLCSDGGLFGGADAEWSNSAFAGASYADSHTESVTAVWDPAQEELGAINELQQLQSAATEAAITGANSQAVIRNLLLQQAELLIELDIAVNEFNRVAAEHNQLVNRYHQWLNLREQAQENLVDSYLNNPAYRIVRDHATIEAGRSIGLAAQFAYLTAKALEYEFLTRYPNLGDIYKARTADDIDNFLNGLEAFRVAIGSPGERNRYPYRISLARDVLGLTDENLDPQNELTASDRAQRRFADFQDVLQQNVITDTATGEVIAIEIPFTTSLRDSRIFSPNVWNNRIAGVGLPPDVPNTQGVAINLLTRQFGDVGTPEIQLTHDGHASYRTATGEIVEYVPENAQLSGYTVPSGFESKAKTATILSSVNGNGQGTPSSALFNRSVAASSWTLRIDLRSPFNSELDLAQVEDIEIAMDTTGIALANRVQAAQEDSVRLRAAFEK